MAKKDDKELIQEIGKINERDISTEMRECYIDYAMSVIVSRALPDVRDGLKPVQRRILYAMYEIGVRSDAKFRKSAAVTGEVMGKYHPHGDAAIYAALVRMAQDFSLRYPLVKGQGNFGCFTADTKVKLTDGRDLSFLDLVKEYKDGKRNFTFTAGKDGKIKIAEIKHPRKTKHAEIMKVLLDNGEEIKCTLDHKFLLKTGEYKEAQDLSAGDSVMPSYFRQSTKQDDPNMEGYNMIFQPISGIWEYVHMLADEWNIENGIYQKNRGKIRHHLDFNKLNNNPENIQRMYWREHWETHYNFTSEKHKNDPVYREKLAQGRNKFWSNPKNREAYSNRLSQRNIENWRKEEYRETMRQKLSEVNIAYFKNHPEKIKEISQRATETLKRLWQIPEYRAFFHEKIAASNKKRETNQTGKKKFDRICQYLKEHNLDLTKDNYEEARVGVFGTKSFTSWDLGLKKYYQNDKSLVLCAVNGNHKVIGKEFLKETADVYDLTIEDSHNFALSAGIFVHNSIDGDMPAAQRYTECKLSRPGEELLQDIEKETVNFVENYDSTKKEPSVLPSPLPNLLLNGSTGIAVGMATNIPPHNLTEVCSALIHLIDNPKAETEDLFEFVKGPDFPTGGIIYNQKDILAAYSQGKGSFLMRGKVDIIEKEGKGAQIVATEIPFQVDKSVLITQLANLVQNKKVDGIKDIRDESDKDGLRIAIDLQKGAVPRKVLNALYKHTDLQKNYHLNMLALVNGIEPRILSLKDVLELYLAHKQEVVVKRTQFDLQKAKDRAHILEGISKALDHIDAVIETIRKSKDKEDAKINLSKKFKLTLAQAEAILEIRLHQLAKLEKQKIEDELAEMMKRIKELTKILESKAEQKKVMKKEIEAEIERYGDERKTKIVKNSPESISEEDLIPLEDTIVTLTAGGYIKRMNPSEYKKQNRGGQGNLGMKTSEDDEVSHFITAKTHDSIFFFTDSGKVFQTKVYEIPEGQRTNKGRGLMNFLEISSHDKILSVLPISKEDRQSVKYLIMATKNGIVKKTPLKDFENVRRNGLIAINLKNGDVLTSARKAGDGDEIILATKHAQSIRFSEKDVRPMGRAASGIKGIRIKKDDGVIGMEVVRKDQLKDKDYLLVLTENGYGKRTLLTEYKKQGRGGSGVKTAKVTAKTGELVKIEIIEKQEDLIVISLKGQVIRTKIASIPKLGRDTQGVRIMRMKDGDKVVSAACLTPEAAQ